MVLFIELLFVALLAEGVDRNTRLATNTKKCGDVALLAEGVDRNGIHGRLQCGL